MECAHRLGAAGRPGTAYRRRLGVHCCGESSRLFVDWATLRIHRLDFSQHAHLHGRCIPIPAVVVYFRVTLQRRQAWVKPHVLWVQQQTVELLPAARRVIGSEVWIRCHRIHAVCNAALAACGGAEGGRLSSSTATIEIGSSSSRSTATGGATGGAISRGATGLLFLGHLAHGTIQGSLV